MPQIDSFLNQLVQKQGSDLHISAGAPPMARVHGRVVPIGDKFFSSRGTSALLEEIMPPEILAAFRACHDVDFAYECSGLGRFRVNGFLDRSGPGAVLRHVPERVPSLADLNLPSVVQQFSDIAKGLVLITGPTGSGKSTTLAAIVDAINREKQSHIITIEDPIEFVHQHQSSLINQREVGAHTDSFASGLRASLREDPDVILVGEMRDLETTAMAIEAAETGHLVLATLHTSSAASTVDRIIDQFPAGQQSQIRTMLSASLQAVVSQCLLVRADRGGRVAALEILVSTPAVNNLIREGKTHQLISAIQTGARLGMTTMNDSIVKLVGRREVDAAEGYLKSHDKEGLLKAYRIAGIHYTPPLGGRGHPGARPGVGARA